MRLIFFALIATTITTGCQLNSLRQQNFTYGGPGLNTVMYDTCRVVDSFETYHSCVSFNWVEPMKTSLFYANNEYIRSVLPTFENAGENLLLKVKNNLLSDIEAVVSWRESHERMSQKLIDIVDREKAIARENDMLRAIKSSKKTRCTKDFDGSLDCVTR